MMLSFRALRLRLCGSPVLWSGLVLLVFCGLYACTGRPAASPEPVPGTEAVPDTSLSLMAIFADTSATPEWIARALSSFEARHETVGRGENFASILGKAGMDYNRIHAMTERTAPVFDLRKLRVGNDYVLYARPGEEEPTVMEYHEGQRSRVYFVFGDSLAVVRRETPVEVVLKSVEVTISQSIWADLERAGCNPLVSLPLSEVYAWTIDFFGLQKGDSFEACYESYVVGDKEVEVGPILTASFTHVGQTYKAYRFMQDSVYGYWDAEGVNLQKAFLKAPLRYSRVSSRFSYARRHPVTRVVRPHTGVDYAAPTGTPVVSIGSGTVIQRAYAGGGGNTVKIRHNSIYTTAYLHLSKFAKGLTVGSRVSQGQVIGYVGSTGTSTGPHLDFRVWKNGTPVNPLTMEAPPSDPVHEAHREVYARWVAHWDRVMAEQKEERLLRDLLQ